jgi:hypothetical protein
MGYRIEDGTGSRNKANIFENKVREFAASVSLINHLSGEPIEGEQVVPTTDVYESRTISYVAGSGGSLIYLVNNSPSNFVVVDRTYTNEILPSSGLPNTSTYVQVLMSRVFTAGTGTQIVAVNSNRAIPDIQPDITLLNGATTSGGVELSRRYLNINKVYFQEPIVQKSDGIVLGKGNTIELFLATLTSATVETNMRFAVVTKEDLGF